MIYIILFIFIIITSLALDFRKVKIKDDGIYYFIMVVFILIAGLRWKVGGDTLSYQAVFDKVPSINEFYSFIKTRGFIYEPFFLISLSVVKTFTNEFWVYQMIHAIFVNVVIFKTIKKYCDYKFFAICLYYYIFFVYFNMEILREVISIAIFLLIYPLLSADKLKKYYFFSVIAMLFHVSSTILLIMPLLAKVKFTKKSTILLVGIVIVLAVIFIFVPEFIQALLFNDYLSEKVNIYSGISANLNGMILNLLLFVLLPIYILRLNKKNHHQNFQNLHFAYFLFATIFVLISGFGRFLNYFVIFMIIYFVNTFKILNKAYFLNISKFAFVIVSLSIIFYYKYSYYNMEYDHLIKGSHKYDFYYPYNSVLNPNIEYDNYRHELYLDTMWDSFNKDK